MTAQYHEGLVEGMGDKNLKERFLQMDADSVRDLLEKDPEFFDSLKKETSALVIRKLTELIKLFKAENAEAEEKLKAVKEGIYENLESKTEPECLKGFTEEQKKTIITETDSIELTLGCSLGCPFCGFNAKIKVRDKIPFSDLVYLIRHYGTDLDFDKKPEFFLYWASDPFDYEDDDKNYLDAVELFDFYVGRPFTSTAYPEGKKELLKEMIEKGYMGRVSVSDHNIERLERDGWVKRNKDGSFSTPYKALQDFLFIEEYDYKIPKRDVSAGRAFKEDQVKGVGGIECQMGVVLKRDGFYNGVVFIPSAKKRTGVIHKKIEPEKICQKIDVKNPPKKIDELIQYGVVENRGLNQAEIQNFVERVYVVLDNFYDGKKRKYFADYDPRSFEVIDFVEMNDDEEKEMQAYINVRIASKTESLKGNRFNILYAMMPVDYSLGELKKTSWFYKKLGEVCKEVLEDFVSASDLSEIVKNYSWYGRHGVFTADSFYRTDIVELVTGFRNAFILAHDVVTDMRTEVIDQIEKKFMDSLFNELTGDNGLGTARISDEEYKESIAFLKQVFGK